MKKKILLIQFRTDKSIMLEKECIIRASGIKKDDLKIINAFNKSVDFSMPEKILTGISKVILGGSGEFYLSGNKNKKEDKKFWQMIKKVSPFIRYLLNKDIPTFGICFGHQLLAYNLGVKIVQDKKQQETGSFCIRPTKKGRANFLFKNVPQKFIAQLGHKDSLECVPENSDLLAKSKKCKAQAFHYKDNIYGVQFHPEMTSQDAISRLKLYPDYNHKTRSKKMITKIMPSSHATKILKNFTTI